MTTIGGDTGADVRVVARHVGREGSRATLHLDGRTIELTTVMRGTHNLDNVIVAAVTAVRAGIAPTSCRRCLATSDAPPGSPRTLRWWGAPARARGLRPHARCGRGSVLVGRGLLSEGGRLIVVSEPVVTGTARSVGRWAWRPPRRTVVIVTDDNPRSEDPAAIRAAVLGGCPAAGAHPGSRCWPGVTMR
jgi:UDP-N-acetylmuramoyl-L-alanyl-D-glutamate--2,6-diaminopimelate ligase